MLKLKNIAEIQTGYSFRSRLRNQTEYNISVIQMKDLTNANIVDTSALTKIYLDKYDSRHVVKKSDLIFRSRGQNNTAVLLDSELKDVILAAPLFKMRLKNNLVLSEYLLWFLNNPESQNWFSKRREGSHGGMISKVTLEEFEVLVPPIDKQKQILEIEKLMVTEEHIIGKLAVLRKKYNSNLLLKTARGE